MIYLQWQNVHDGDGRTHPQIVGKNPFGCPPVSLFKMWRADCFPVSENKPDYPQHGGVGRWSKLIVQKKRRERSHG